MSRAKNMSFEDGNKIVKEYIERAKEKLDVVAKKSDNVVGFIATVDSQNGEEGVGLNFISNVTVLDIVRCLSNLGNKNEPFRTAISMTAEYFRQNPEDADFEVDLRGDYKPKKGIIDMFKDLFKKDEVAGMSLDSVDVKLGGVVRVRNGKPELVPSDDIPDDIKAIMKQMGITTDPELVTKKEDIKVAPKTEAPAKKKVSMKKLLAKPKKVVKKKK